MSNDDWKKVDDDLLKILQLHRGAMVRFFLVIHEHTPPSLRFADVLCACMTA